MQDYIDIREQVEEQRYSVLYLEVPTTPSTYINVTPESAVDWINSCEIRNVPIKSHMGSHLWGFNGSLTLVTSKQGVVDTMR